MKEHPSGVNNVASRLVVGFGFLLACGDSGEGVKVDAAKPDSANHDAKNSDAARDATPVDAAVDAGSDAGMMPDLTIIGDRARADLAIREKEFSLNSCELDPDEACIGGPGLRTLLHFSVETPNIGDADMFLGNPDPENPQFQYSMCHDHYHFLGYAEYALKDARGEQLATGRKQAFCLLDSEKYLDDDPSVSKMPKYNCTFQGIQRGWADVYYSSLPCQFIDITDLPVGTYSLEVSLNNGGTLPEKDYENNFMSFPVNIGANELRRPTEPCAEDLDPHASDTTNRECGWKRQATYECEPGTTFHVGCAKGCGLGSCTGNAMLRICDAERPDGNCSYPANIATDDDACGTKCPLAFGVPCPDSGKVSVFTAPLEVGQPYTCNLEFQSAN